MGVSRSGGFGFRVFWLWGVGFQVQALGRVCEWGGGGGGFKAFLAMRTGFRALQCTGVAE